MVEELPEEEVYTVGQGRARDLVRRWNSNYYNDVMRYDVYC